jgi:hypothetical protein
MRKKGKPARRVVKFGRAILPPGRFHSARSGAKGFHPKRDRPTRSGTRETVEREWGSRGC